MSKTVYIKKNFTGSTLLIIDKANEIIEEYEADGLRLTLRQLYYQFVARGMSENSQRSYKRLGGIISDGRLAGLINWEAIEDRTRNLKSLNHWSNPGEIVRAAARGFRLDHWQKQTYRPEVWIEKEALTGVIEGVCRELDVSYFACKGYVSQSEMWSASQRLINLNYTGQIPVIIHLGDHDPSGIDMTRDILDRQTLFLKNLDCKVVRIALNMDQVEKYDPPPNPAKLSDSRCAEYTKKYGTDSWELDALEPKFLRKLIRSTITAYRDDDPYHEVLEQEKEYLNVLARVEKNWRKL